MTKQFTAKCPYGKKSHIEGSLRQSVLTTQFPLNEMSLRQSVHAVKFPYNEMSYGEISHSDKSYGKKSGHDYTPSGCVNYSNSGANTCVRARCISSKSYDRQVNRSPFYVYHNIKSPNPGSNPRCIFLMSILNFCLQKNEKLYIFVFKCFSLSV